MVDLDVRTCGLGKLDILKGHDYFISLVFHKKSSNIVPLKHVPSFSKMIMLTDDINDMLSKRQVTEHYFLAELPSITYIKKTTFVWEIISSISSP